MRMTLMLTAAMLVATTPVRAVDAVTAGPAVDELKKLDAAMSVAAVKRDVPVFERHTADEFVLTDPMGMVSGKKACLECFKNGVYQFEAMKDTEVKAIVYGEGAVLTGRSDIKGTVGGQDITGAYRWTRVFVRRDGRWQCSAEQLTRIAQP
jgi:ketosteroid isomerase-like protein